MSYFTGIIGIFIAVVKKLTDRMLYGHGNTRRRYYHQRFCGENILLSVSGGPLEYPQIVCISPQNGYES